MSSFHQIPGARTKIVEILREIINPKFWNSFWLFAPATAIFPLPIGLIFMLILALFGYEGGDDGLLGLLMIFSIIYGILIGAAVLLLADELEVPSNLTNKIKWLAVFAIVVPLFSNFILLWAFCC